MTADLKPATAARAGSDADSASLRLDALLSATPDAVIVIDAEARILSMNPAAVRMFGFAADEAIGQDVKILMPEDVGADHGEHVARFARTGEPRVTEQPRQLVARRRDGSEFPMELSIGRITADSGTTFVGIIRDVSVREATLSDLEATQERLRNAQALAHLGSFETTVPDETHRYWSSEMFRIVGLSPRSTVPTLADFVEHIVHGEDRERVSRTLAGALKDRARVDRVEYRIVRPDGRTRHVQTVFEVESVDDPGSLRISGTMQDLTERKRIEYALRMERDRAQRYLDLVDVVIMALDVEGRVTLMNRRGCELLGYREVELLGQDFFSTCLPPDVADPSWLAHQAAIRGGYPEFGLREAPLLTRGGEQRLVRWRTQFIRDASGEIVGTLSAGEDVTEQRSMEDQLRKAEEEVRLTFQHAPIGMATFSLAGPAGGPGPMLSANQALCAMLGFPLDELLGKRLADLVAPDDLADTQAGLKDFIGGRRDLLRLEKRYVSKSGDLIPATSRFSLVLDRYGRPLMLIAQIVDRTDLLRAEAEARQHRERLAHVARLGAMGEMAAGIAHELNQPLAAIATYTQAVQRLLDTGGMEHDELADVLSRVAGQAQRAGQVISRLRKFVRRGTIERRLQDLNQLIRDILTLAEPGARDHGVALVLELDGEIPPVQVDGVQIQQVILNLIRNAIDAVAAHGGDSPAVTLRTRLDADDEVSLVVEDTGTGIPEDIALRLFEPFFTTKQEGMGLGLPLSRSIVEAHGGHLIYAARPGGGSIFTINLPAAVESAS